MLNHTTTANTYQLDVNYKGFDISIMTMPSPGGWAWEAVINDRQTIEGDDGSLPSPEMALVTGRTTVEDLIDSGDEC